MKNQQIVSIQQMKEVLAKKSGSKFPLKITLENGDVIVRYVRGFADQQTNILLISENSYTQALRILEVKEISRLEFAEERSDASWQTLQVK